MSSGWIGLVAMALGCSGSTTEEPTDKDASEDTASPTLPISTERSVLHEVFTGSNCGPCFGADALIDEVLHETTRRYTVIKYQVGSDPYTTTEGVRRRMFYLPGESTYAIPHVHADGVNGFHPAEINDSAGYALSNLDAFADIESPLRLWVTHTVTEQTVDISIGWTALSDVLSEDLVVHAAIIENKTTANVGTNGQAEFHQVMKKMVPDNEGTALSGLSREDEGSLDLSYTFVGDYNGETVYGDFVDHTIEHTVEEFDDLDVVVWVQDNDTWQVHQSAWTIE
jgi:hypothetical protein